MAAKLDDIDLWRVTYGEVGGSSIEEYRARQPDRFKQMLPGNPSPGEYQLLNISPYKMHQRCAEKFRVDRVVLAADAAHVCNPWYNIFPPPSLSLFQLYLNLLLGAVWVSQVV